MNGACNMTNFYAKICTKGHTLVESRPLNDNEYCEKCGATMIAKCPKCGKSIKEWHYDDRIIAAAIRNFPRPLYCKSCGNPYPWTESAIQNAKLLIQEEEKFSEQLRTSLVDSLPDIVSETPGTNVAVVRVKKFFASAGKFTSDAIRQFVIDFGCELAKKLLGL